MSTANVLVVANRTCPCPALLEHLVQQRPASVHIVVPALNGRLAHYVSDTGEAVTAAKERLLVALATLRGAGMRTTGEIGDAKPVLAIEDALADFEATELLISTWPAGRSHWLERGLLRDAERFGLPVVHMASPYGVDAEAVTAQPAA